MDGPLEEFRAINLFDPLPEPLIQRSGKNSGTLLRVANRDMRETRPPSNSSAGTRCARLVQRAIVPTPSFSGIRSVAVGIRCKVADFSRRPALPRRASHRPHAME